MTPQIGQGSVYWITGLSGAGKSTLAQALHVQLQAAGQPTVIVDGDAVRALLLSDASMDRGSRLRIAEFNGRLCRFLAMQGLHVVCATISLFHSVQAWNRAHLPNYTEICLTTPLEFLIERDPNGLYARARAGEIQHVVGLDIVPEWPTAPDFVFTTEHHPSPTAMAETILSNLGKADHR